MNDSSHVTGYVASIKNFSTSVNFTPSTGPELLPPKWGVLAIVPIVFCTALGNLLVCLAVIWDRRLQNMTNYFLMSLAIADFLVSILVMPFGMLVELFGMAFLWHIVKLIPFIFLNKKIEKSEQKTFKINCLNFTKLYQ